MTREKELESIPINCQNETNLVIFTVLFLVPFICFWILGRQSCGFHLPVRLPVRRMLESVMKMYIRGGPNSGSISSMTSKPR